MKKQKKEWYPLVKSAADRLLALLLLFPLLLFILLLLIPQLVCYGSVFFRQLRPGLNGKGFYLLKFKTMKDGNLPDSQRLTPLGRILRKTSLDELPQVINILKGEMSFIGPRPLLEEYLTLYSRQHQLRHQVLPGITGLAQVSLQAEESWRKKLDLDVYYVRNRSLRLDLQIFFTTLLLLAGLHRGPGETLGKFTGYEQENK